jgi:hypothetical protein
VGRGEIRSRLRLCLTDEVRFITDSAIVRVVRGLPFLVAGRRCGRHATVPVDNDTSGHNYLPGRLRQAAHSVV